MSGYQQTHTCFRCTMQFEVKAPHGANEVTVCAEPGCDLRFWHSSNGSLPGLARVGVDPKDLGYAADA